MWFYFQAGDSFYAMDEAGMDNIAAEILEGLVCLLIPKLLLRKLTYLNWNIGQHISVNVSMLI